jgi:hypothetical protein
MEPRFNSSEWQGRFNPDTLRPAYACCDSPISVVATDYFRTIAGCESLAATKASVDKFVLASGQPPEPHLTKIGGLPYRPKDAPWPRDRDDRPLAFLMQFYFGDSADIISDLPGDVLLMFVRTMRAHIFPAITPYIYPFAHLNSVFFEWRRIGEGEALTSSDEAAGYQEIATSVDNNGEKPQKPWVIPTCYGVRRRSVDFHEHEAVEARLDATISNYKLPSGEFDRRFVLRAIARHYGLKIGGLPIWWDGAPTEPPTGKFLGSFSGVTLCYHQPYPWANRPSRMSFDEAIRDENSLDFGIDSGCMINLYLRQDGSVDWYSDFGDWVFMIFDDPSEKEK